MSNDRWMDSNVVHIHIHNGVLVIKRNGIGLFVEMWMDLESVITELSKSEKNKYILTNICGI